MHPNISKGTVIGITDAILIVLFVVQPLGITKITFKAFNPGYCFGFLIRNGEHGWRMLGGILLAFTGVKALFADLGAFKGGLFN